MGSSKQSQTTNVDIAQSTGSNRQLQQLLSALGIDTAGQFGNLGDLASGNVGTPTAADQSLVEQSIGASSDIARRELERTIQQMMSGLDEELAARGIQGSSIEAVNRGQVYGRGVDQIANMLSQQQAQGAQALMNLPFQRAQTQIGANQALLQRLTGTGGQALSNDLQERLAGATTKTSQTQNRGFFDYLQLGTQLGGALLPGTSWFGGGGGQPKQ